MDLTLYITLYSRRWTLPRIMEYYRDFPGKLVVADAWADPGSNQKKYPRVTFLDLRGKNFYEVMQSIGKDCKTRWMCWCNDDDFAPVSGLKTCVDFFGKHPEEYTMVMGQQFMIGNEGYGKREYAHWSFPTQSGNSSDFAGGTRTSSLYPQHSPFSHAETRLRNMFRVFHTPVHAVIRPELMQEAAELVLANPHLFPIRFFDKVFGYVAALRGEKKVLPTLTSIRTQNRLIDQRGGYPAELKREVPFENIIRELETQGDPLAELLTRESLLQTHPAIQTSRSSAQALPLPELRKAREITRYVFTQGYQSGLNRRPQPGISFPSDTPAGRAEIKKVKHIIQKYPKS